MNNTRLEQQVRKALYTVAPDVKDEPLDPKQRFRDQFEFDSMDFLRFVMELNKLTGVDIPESAYADVETLDATVNYLSRHAPA